MAQSNPTRSDLCGAVIPWPYSLTLAADYAHGTDYTEADRRVGITTHDAASRPPGTFVADASKAPDTDATQALLQVKQAGNAGLDGATVLSRASTSDPWRGYDGPAHPAGTQAIIASGASQSSIVALDDGTALLAAAFVVGDDIEVYTYTRSTAGVWGSGTLVYSVTMDSTPSYAPVLLMWSGSTARRALLLYGTYIDPRQGDTVCCWRSTDDGSTWSLQSGDAGIVPAPAGVRWLAGTSLPGSEVVLFTTVGSGTSSIGSQYRSSDGGVTFAQIDSATSQCVVWSAVEVAGLVHVAFVEGGTAKIVRLGSGRVHWADETSPVSVASMDYAGGMALLQEPTGKLWWRIAGIGGISDERIYVSTDLGISWTDLGSYDHAGNYAPGIHSACVLRGQHVVVGPRYDPSASTVNGQVLEATYGGLRDVTLATVLTMPSVRYLPVQLLGDDGFVQSDTGSPVRTLGPDYTQVACAAGVTAQERKTVSGASGEYSQAARVVCRVTAGTGTVRITVATTVVDIDVTATQTRAYESGGSAPSYTTTHTSGEYVEILALVRSSDGAAAVFVRQYDTASERAYTELTTLTGMTSGGSGPAYIACRVAAESTVRWRMVTAGVELSYGGGLIDGIDRPDDLEGIPISVTGFSYVGDGVHVRATGGPYPVDGTTYTVPVTSLNPKSATLPAVNPSPRSGLVTSSGGACTLRYTTDHASGSASAFAPPGAWVVYLDGLVGVGDVTVYDNASGSAIGSTSRIAYQYELAGGVLRTDTTGAATVPDAYVRTNELAGWYFESANGKVRRISGNTDGHFDGTDTGHTCTLFIEGFDGTETLQGSGYLYPKRMAIIVYQRGSRRMNQLRLVLGAHTSFTQKEVGIVVAGPLLLMGRGVDKTMSVSVEGGAQLETLPDGTRSRSTQAPLRRRWEFGVGLDSVVDLRNVYADMSELPDHVDISDHASAKPAGTRHATPLSVQGLYQMADRQPMLFIPAVPRDDGTGDRAQFFVWRDCENFAYGRLVNSTRRTLTLGKPGRDGMWRSSNIAMEEEL